MKLITENEEVISQEYGKMKKDLDKMLNSLEKFILKKYHSAKTTEINGEKHLL